MGDRLDVFVPADRAARVATAARTMFGFVGGTPFLGWKIWSPVGKAAVAHAAWPILASRLELAIEYTLAFSAAYIGIAWLMSLRTRPVAITAGPQGVRCTKVGTYDGGLHLPLARIENVKCVHSWWRDAAAISVTGRFGRWKRLRTHHPLAVGDPTEMNLLASELLAVLGLTAIVNDRSAAPTPPPASLEGQ